MAYSTRFQSAPKSLSYAQIDSKMRKVTPKCRRNTAKVASNGFTKSLKSIGKMRNFGKLSALEAHICIGPIWGVKKDDF